MSFTRKVAIAFGLGSAILLALAVLSYRESARTATDEDWVAHTHAVRAQIEGLYGDLTGAEANQRGYIITGEDDYLKLYSEAVASVHENYSSVQRLTADNPVQQAALDDLNPLIILRLSQMQESINSRVAQGPAAGIAAVQNNRGGDTMAGIRAIIARMTAEEDRLLTARTAMANASERKVKSVIVLGYALAFVFLFVASAVVYNEMENRRKAEESAEIYGSLVQSVKDYAIFVLDTRGRVVTWNPGAEKIKGYRASEIIGQHLSKFYPPDDVAAGKPEIELNTAAVEGQYEEEGWRVRKDGSRFWASVTITAVRDSEGNLRGFSKVTGDFTQRKKIADALQLSERKFRALFDFSPDAIVVSDQKGKIVQTNSQVRAVFGYGHDELFGLRVETLIPERFRNLHPGHRAEYNAHPRTRPMGAGMELYGKRKDGTEFPVEISLSPLETEEGVLVTSAIRDISERRRVEREIARRSAELEAANKELETFCYSVSHDLRAPLRGIDGFSQALLEDYGGKLDSAAQDSLQRIRAATQRMGMLIDDLLNLSRFTRMEMQRQPTDLSAIGKEVAATLQQSQPRRDVEVVIAPELRSESDPRLMRVVLENLLGNAWKFTSKKQHARIEFGKTKSNETSAFFVKDNGAGFDPAYAGRLFGAFQRLHAMTEFPGTGVGLATVQRIILRHGGRIWAESAVDQGATFYFTV
jgi:PAS domain S-box-containing protein